MSFLDRLTLSFLPFKSAIRLLRASKVSYTPRRLLNFFKIWLSMNISKLSRKPVVWGYAPVLMVEPTNICNLKCPMCPSGNGDMARPKGKLDLDNFRRLMDDVGDYIFLVQFWNQGEPFINKSFIDFVKYAKSKGVMTQTSTNGHFVRDDEAADEVILSGLDQIIFSMDGTNQQTYEQYRVGGNYNLVLETLGRLSEAKKRHNSKTPFIELQFIVFKHNQNEIDEIIRLAKRFKVDHLSFKTAQVYSADQAEEFLPDDTDMRRYSFDGDHLQLKDDVPNWCKRLWMNSTVNWDGSVSPCCFDKDADHAFANIFTDGVSFRETWTNNKYMNFRRSVLKNRKAIDMCRNCTEGLKEPYARVVNLDEVS